MAAVGYMIHMVIIGKTQFKRQCRLNYMSSLNLHIPIPNFSMSPSLSSTLKLISGPSSSSDPSGIEDQPESPFNAYSSDQIMTLVTHTHTQQRSDKQDWLTPDSLLCVSPYELKYRN